MNGGTSGIMYWVKRCRYGKHKFQASGIVQNYQVHLFVASCRVTQLYTKMYYDYVYALKTMATKMVPKYQ